MSLDIDLIQDMPCSVFEINITHNLASMADEAGLYSLVWRPDENAIIIAEQLIGPLRAAIKDMKENPDKYKKHNPPNGWGSYEGFLAAMEKYLVACEEYPNARIEVSR